MNHVTQEIDFLLGHQGHFDIDDSLLYQKNGPLKGNRMLEMDVKTQGHLILQRHHLL